MDNTREKLLVQFVAYFDLVTSIIALVGLGVLTVVLLPSSVKRLDDVSGEDSWNYILWWTIAIAFGYIGIVIVVSIFLLQAVQKGTDKAVALRKATTWRNINLMIFILGITATAKNFEVISTIAVLFRGVFLLIVWNFIATLKNEGQVSLTATEDGTGNCRDTPFEQLSV